MRLQVACASVGDYIFCLVVAVTVRKANSQMPLLFCLLLLDSVLDHCCKEKISHPWMGPIVNLFIFLSGSHLKTSQGLKHKYFFRKKKKISHPWMRPIVNLFIFFKWVPLKNQPGAQTQVFFWKKDFRAFIENHKVLGTVSDSLGTPA
jgi:hypothetical protein